MKFQRSIYSKTPGCLYLTKWLGSVVLLRSIWTCSHLTNTSGRESIVPAMPRNWFVPEQVMAVARILRDQSECLFLKCSCQNPPRVCNLGPLTTKNRPGGWNLTPLEGLGICSYHWITIEGFRISWFVNDFFQLNLDKSLATSVPVLCIQRNCCSTFHYSIIYYCSKTMLKMFMIFIGPQLHTTTSYFSTCLDFVQDRKKTKNDNIPIAHDMTHLPW